MCRLVIIDCGMKLRRVWDGHVKRTECLGLSIIIIIIIMMCVCYIFYLSFLFLFLLLNNSALFIT